MNSRKNCMMKISGRKSYQKRRLNEKDLRVDQPDGSLNPKQFKTPDNSDLDDREDQPDGSHSPQQYESSYNSGLEDYVHQPEGSCYPSIPIQQYQSPYNGHAIEYNEKDERDFSFQCNTEPQSILPIKKRHINRSIVAQPVKKQTHPTLVRKSRQQPQAVIVAITILFFFIIYWQFRPANEGTVTNHIQQFSENLKILGIKFDLPNDSLRKIKIGVKTIHDRKSAGSFIILYNSGATNFHKSRFNEMVTDIANATAKYLRNAGNGSFIELESNNIKEVNHEEFMDKYDSILLESGVMLLKDLDNLPTNLAMAFHYFCDEYNALVKKSAIFFTIDKQKCSINSNSELHKRIEKCLAEKWRHMREDSIFPLLARVVEIVVEI